MRREREGKGEKEEEKEEREGEEEEEAEEKDMTRTTMSKVRPSSQPRFSRIFWKCSISEMPRNKSSSP